MMENLEFYNLGCFEPIPGHGGHGLVRVPEQVRNTLNERARFIGMESVGVEIRFVTDAPNIDLYVSVQKPEFGARGSIRVFKGNFQCQNLEVESGIVSMFRINPTPSFDSANEKMLNKGGFASNVWRIVFDRSIYVFHGINFHGHDVRKPHENELPAIDWLAYGSSITNSSLDGYPHVAAKILGWQVQNMGLSGACHIEKELVDYMLDKRHFDVISCELGVNMRGIYTPEEFEKRATYLVERLMTINKPCYIITIFPNLASEAYCREISNTTRNEMAYNEILIKLVNSSNNKNIHLIHGYEILSDTNGLSGDLLHPTTIGHALMGMNLAKCMGK